MPFPKSAQIKGGKASASEYQKIVARQTIAQTRPWTRSSGAKTAGGKAIAGQNAAKNSIRWHFRAHEVSDFAATLDRIRLLFEEFKRLNQRYESCWKDSYSCSSFTIGMKIRFKTGKDTEGDWATVAVYIVSTAYWRGGGGLPEDLKQFQACYHRELLPLLQTGCAIVPTKRKQHKPS